MAFNRCLFCNDNFTLSFKNWAGGESGIGGHIPGENRRGHLEEENVSQGHGCPLPCPF